MPAWPSSIELAKPLTSGGECGVDGREVRSQDECVRVKKQCFASCLRL